jgi:hypothetical protein
LCGINLSANVLINAPTNGATLTSPVQLNVSVTGQTPNTIFIYDGSNLILQKSGTSSIQSSLTLTAGSHTITALARYNRGSSAQTTSTITVSSSSSGGGGSSNPGLAAQIANDMQGSNEDHPHGVPLSYDWANGPVVEMGNNPNGWQALTAWGVIYVGAEGNTATNTRVNIRNVEALLLQKSTGKWLLLQNTNTPDGAAYLEDFSGDSNKPADIRRESDGTISVTAGGGYNFHFYPSNRASINPNDIGGIVTFFEARLIVGNTSKPDDRSIAHYLGSAGADYYPALTGGWPGNLSYNPGVAVGKMKYIESAWRSFCMTTMTQAQLSSNPPPINFSGILP